MAPVKCSNCDFNFDRNPPENCPKCGHDKFSRDIIETDSCFGTDSVSVNHDLVLKDSVKYTDSVTVMITARRELIIKNSRHILIGLMMFFVGIWISQMEHELSLLFGIIIGVFGVTMIPIKEIREGIPKEL